MTASSFLHKETLEKCDTFYLEGNHRRRSRFEELAEDQNSALDLLRLRCLLNNQ